ncbi:MAG: MotA/TolQ/ExbB proton channel family protein [Hyphomicrobium sp.]|nr:MotA/TolQ/ExbB proton channel family protein [Hyphomicrobium sp.]
MLLVAAGHPFSIWEMVLAADPIVKGVMLLLLLSSIACWAIVLEKAVRMWRLGSDLREIEAVAEGQPESNNGKGLVRNLLSAAEREAHDGGSRGEARSDVRARLERAMKLKLKAELERIEAGLPFLATIGSAAPFIGLFGTVWGIMNSFTAIAARQDTSLATVAPGIAEALFATALGLAAAIPAVMAYNHFAVRLGRASARGSHAIAEIAKHISRPGLETVVGSGVEPLRAGKGH